MKWQALFSILGLGLGCSLPARAQDEMADTNASSTPREGEEFTAANDEEAPQSGDGKFVLGLRLGYALPMGATSENNDGSSEKMSDGVSGHFPIWLDVGYMVSQEFLIGLYGQYAFGGVAGQLKAQCDQASSFGLSCSARDIRFGLQFQFHPVHDAKVDPWLGVGVGYEWLTVSISGAGQDGSTTGKGFEFANLQAGLDYKALPNFGVGPFVSFSLGQYDSVSNSGSLAEASSGGDIANPALHEWLTFGVRGAFRL
jgi:outer membrane protein W